MKLSAEQRQAFDSVMAWMKGKQKRFVLAGYAGTGKTTLAKYIADEIGASRVAFCAYTGKAANVLREKGCENSTTVHGAIYKLVGEDGGSPYFDLDTDSSIKDRKLVIVDEYSMLPEEIIADIESLAKKVLYLGDPFQLPPVQGKCVLEPDFFITEVHRQALESPIIRFATDVREGRELKFCTLNEFIYQPRAKIAPEAYYEADQVIVGLNKTRTAWNDRFRQKLGFSGKCPAKGDRLICTKNNHEMGLFNGMIGEAEEYSIPSGDEQISVHFAGLKNLPTWDGNFVGRVGQPERDKRKLNRFDFGYVITCHKSQGSEFDSVLVFNQPIGADQTEKRRWQYTAISRARKKITLVQP